MALPEYEVFALRYATVERQARTNFLLHDEHDGPMPLDFFIWAVRGGGRCVVIDTGFSAYSASKRNRVLTHCPAVALAAIGIAAETIEDVVITHLHYDHAGNLDKFPAARFHLQDSEMAYVTGRCMTHAALRNAYEVEDVVAMVRRVYTEQVRFHDGDAELAPGISLHRIGGHTDGLQVVRVHTKRGWVVVASDASHYYANMGEANPFPIVVNVRAMLEGYRRMAELADSEEHIVPGHDPEVLRIYPRADVDGVPIALLHQPPTDKPAPRKAR